MLAGEARDTGDAPSTTRSYTDLQGLRRRYAQFPKGVQRQEQDEIELNPIAPDRPASTARTSDDDDGQSGIEGCGASQGGIHVSRRYEVFTESTRNKGEPRTLASTASAQAVASNSIL